MTKDWENEFNENISMEQALERFGEIKSLVPGEVMEGEVVNISGESILIDVGSKAEALLPASEAIFPLQVGDRIGVLIERRRDAYGHPLVSQKKAALKRSWEKIIKSFKTRRTITGKVIQTIKGGFMVNLDGVEAFLPASQVNHRSSPHQGLIGRTIPLRITELNQQRKNIVVSHRLAMEEERKALKEKTINELEVGQVVKGKVSNITGFGAFVDIGGIDGLLHIKDISWGHTQKVEDVLKIGEELELKVLSFDRKKNKISLGLKQLTEHPWEKAEEKYPVGSVVSGRVTSLTRYGAFVELEPGLEGMIHISEMSWSGDIKDPKQILKVGDLVESRVLDIKKEKQRLGLGLKQIQPNPWKEAEKKYKPGQRIKGKVSRLAPFGAFVRLPEGIEGLIHVSDMSWTRKIKHPGDVIKKGDVIEAVVLEINAEKEKIALGLKQKGENPWNRYPKGSNICGTVTRISNYGAFVRLDKDIEGLIHISQIALSKVNAVEDVLSVGDRVTAKVTKVEEKDRKVELSIKEYLKEREREEMEKYINQPLPSTLGEILAGKEEQEEAEE